tara:strand:- start:3894 stop:4964 length:1071 start_codon:yes stop_codon:yes gene_type:complete
MNKKLKLLLVSNMYPDKTYPSFGIFVKKTKEGLEEFGFDISDCVVMTKKSFKLTRIFFYLKFYIKIFFKVIFRSYDAIYIHFITHCSPAIFILLFFKPKMKVISNTHGSDVLRVNSKLLRYFSRIVLNKSFLIISPSKYFIKHIKSVYSLTDKNKIITFPSGGIDTDFFKPLKRSHNDEFTVGYISRIDIGKGWDILIDAINILKLKSLNLKVIMAGSGNQIDQMNTKIKENRLEDIINYIGHIHPNDLPFFYNQFDVFILSSILDESLGLVGLEALSCGIPVIASDKGGQISYLNQKNGILFETGNAHELAMKIHSISNQDLSKMKYYARETALNYDKEKVFSELCNQLHNLLNG